MNAEIKTYFIVVAAQITVFGVLAIALYFAVKRFIEENATFLKGLGGAIQNPLIQGLLGIKQQPAQNAKPSGE